jgi:fluoride ion exporter CrcB/FEX
MRKQTIVILYGLGLLLWIISVVLFIQLIVSLSGYAQPNGEMLVIEIVVGLSGGLLMMASLIGTLINLCKAGQWDWFLCLLFLSIFAIPVYVLTGPTPQDNTGKENTPLVKP